MEHASERGSKSLRSCALAVGISCCVTLLAATVSAEDGTGSTGFAAKRPVLASACPHGCPWGELGDYVKDAMTPLGYEVILCRNCNRDQGPRIVSKASHPPELSSQDTFVGTNTRVDAPVDFGITESGFLAWAYAGLYSYASDGPFANLRLIAKIEDPTYLLAAVKADSPITSLAQIAERRMPVKILGGETPIAQPVLDHYGLTTEAVSSWGGSFVNPIIAGAVGGNTEFDLILNELASPANNPESAIWSQVSQKYQLRFLDFSEELLTKLAQDKNLGVTRAVAQWGLVRGVDRPIATVARSGHAVFARDDMPEQAAYDAAKAIAEHRSALKWYIRPYSYDTQTVWKNLDVPLHKGAERYYREQGYLPATTTPSGDAGSCSPNDAGDAVASRARGTDSCSVLRVAAGGTRGFGLIGMWLVVGYARRRARRGNIGRRPGVG